MQSREIEAGADEQSRTSQPLPAHGRLEEDGFVVVPGVLSSSEAEALISELAALFTDAGDASGRGVYGVRGLLEAAPLVRELAASPALQHLVEPILGPDCIAARGILFDKIAGANWKVPWHQDLTVALCERQDTDGFGAWSEKAGIVHAQAPVALLENMLTLRLHLDDCDETNGPLRVLPGTHTKGRLNAAQIQTLRTQIQPIACLAQQGGMVLMRPLLLHASSPALTPRHRRVIHLEYAAANALPRHLQWHTQTR